MVAILIAKGLNRLLDENPDGKYVGTDSSLEYFRAHSSSPSFRQ